MKRISVDQVHNAERFYRVPKLFFESRYYKPMTAESKLLYSMFKDRLELSLKNGWVDEERNIYFIFTIEELCEMLGYGKNKIIKLKKELISYGLLEEVRQGLNKPNKLYLGSVEDKDILEKEPVNPRPERKFKNQTSGSLKNKLQEVSKSNPNDTDISDTDISDGNIVLEEPKNSHEFSAPAEAGKNTPVESLEESGFVPETYYNLLQNIADTYNDRLFCFPDVVRMTHNQKMKIGNLLAEGYITSEQVIHAINRIPADCDKPLAYLFRILENIREERRLEEKIQAHRRARMQFDQVG